MRSCKSIALHHTRITTRVDLTGLRGSTRSWSTAYDWHGWTGTLGWARAVTVNGHGFGAGFAAARGAWVVGAGEHVGDVVGCDVLCVVVTRSEVQGLRSVALALAVVCVSVWMRRF
jgi:hypothetical protein